MNLQARNLQLGLRLTPRFAQLVRGPWIFYSFGLRSMESVLAAVLASFHFVEVDADHGLISEVLEVERQRLVKVKNESDAPARSSRSEPIWLGRLLPVDSNLPNRKLTIE